VFIDWTSQDVHQFPLDILSLPVDRIV